MTRAAESTAQLEQTVAEIISQVRERGDEALREYASRFDGVELSDLRVSETEIAEAEQRVDEALKQAIAVAAGNIERFHAAQTMQPVEVSTMPGVECVQRAVPITNVGLYIPGGNSPLFSTVLMLAVPARLAGCKHIVMCTPPGKDGKVNAAILYAARLAGVTEIYKVGGAQAVAAMAYGTQSIPRVSKIFGPGNRFVMEAKMQVSRSAVAIDMPAGPSEVMVIADQDADADRLAERVENAGSVFIGPYSPESAGDYASGTNHTLPTSGYAKAYSGVNLDSFTKKITFQRLSPEGLRSIGPTIEIMAENEDLMAHRMAVTVRLKKMQ